MKFNYTLTKLKKINNKKELILKLSHIV